MEEGGREKMVDWSMPSLAAADAGADVAAAAAVRGIGCCGCK